MKKKLIVLLLLCFSFISKAQDIPVGEYEVEAEGKMFIKTMWGNSSNQNKLDFIIYFNNGTHIDLVRYHYFDYDKVYNIKEKKNFSASININKYYFRFKFSNSVVGRKYEGTTIGVSQPYNYIIFSDSYNKNKDYFNLRVTITPQLTILNPSPEKNFLPTEDKIVINSHTGFSHNEYNWYYSLDNHSWKSLPQYQGQSSIEVNARDILGNDMEKSIGKVVSIRQEYKRQEKDNYKSNIVRFTVNKSAPRLIGIGESIKPSCYDSTDGEHTLYFDRPLDENEFIHISLVKPNTDIPIDNARLKEDIGKLDPGNTFKIKDLPAGKYEVTIIGKHNDVPIYSPTTLEPYKFTIEKNLPVKFSFAKTDVWCYGGSDGEIHITAEGGVLGYEYQLGEGDWIPFSDTTSTTHTIPNLNAGKYTIKLRDKNGCVAKEIINVNGQESIGDIIELKTELSSPKEALKIEYTLIQEPSFNGASNGKLVAKIDGGTIFDNNTYEYKWKNAKGDLIPATTQYTSGLYYIEIDGIPAGMYYLTISDKNYSNAKENEGCTIIKSQIELAQPKPLKATIELIKPISCHLDNEFGNEIDINPADNQRDESQDGVLKVVAEGGKPFVGNENGGKPYKYTWKKQNTDGTWETLNITEDILPQLSHGNYSVNIEDANGIVIGEYKNNVLKKAKDIEYLLAQPEKLKIDFETINSTCEGADGSAKAIVSGGTPPYSYSWSNGEITAKIFGLEAMPYFVSVIDSRGCIIQGSTTVMQPEDIVITEKIKPLLCYNASNASIELTVEGGTGPYSFLWNTGSTTSVIKDLSAGDYKVTITDAQGCSYVKSYSIDNPEEIKINLGEDRSLCNGQSLELDISLEDDPQAKYLWTSDNGFTSDKAVVNLVEAGTYVATITNGNGCVVSDEIVISQLRMDIASEFFLTTQAYVNEEVVLVNVANPKGEKTEWIIYDDTAIVVEQDDDYITLKFPNEGEYNIGLKQIQGDCFMVFDKKIIVEQSDGSQDKQNVNAGFVKEFSVSPNPNNGVFDITVKLEEDSPISLRLFNSSGKKIQADRKEASSNEHYVNYNMELSPGIYMLVLETPYQTLTKKIVIR